MKKSLRICLVAVLVCLMLPLQILVGAQKYQMEDTDIHITVDDTMWYVFTRDNLQDNPELEELGLTQEQMLESMQEYDAYMDALLIYDDGQFMELFVMKKAVDTGIVNLSNYDEDHVMELAEELAKKHGADRYSTYESRYKFAKTEFYDEELALYVCQYVTIVNKEIYTIKFQSEAMFSDWEHEQMQAIVNSIQFDVDTTLKEEIQESSTWIRVIIGGVAGGIVGLIVALINQKRKKKAEDVFPVTAAPGAAQSPFADSPFVTPAAEAPVAQPPVAEAPVADAAAEAPTTPDPE